MYYSGIKWVTGKISYKNDHFIENSGNVTKVRIILYVLISNSQPCTIAINMLPITSTGIIWCQWHSDSILPTIVSMWHKGNIYKMPNV